ncbi:macrolide family glycosyltransferase [Halobacillus ihumii]|uniref:macrolide family glycosyltransferase n=1 Tax=Halobacillus ihumii TaxID=2686092 RepID=UPI001966F874|nr:macrolide family glycosyltransferase [Halobacillus ihumii]
MHMKILMINFPAEGHVNPTLGMVEGFTNHGDKVHYITTEQFKERLEGVGAVVHLQTDWLQIYPPEINSAKGLNNFLKVHIQTSLDTLQITEKLARDHHFDFVFFDRFGAGELVKDYLRIPGVSSSASFLMPETVMKQLPLHPDSEVPFQLDEETTSMLQALKDRYGVQPNSLLQFMTNTGDLQIVYTSQYFQPNSEQFGEENLFIGPSFPERKGNHDFPTEELKGEKLLYISMGTVLDNQEEFINMCIDAFMNFNGVVIISIGKADSAKLKAAPDHIWLRRYVPQLQVLEKADVFITHGGMNSVNEAIHYHVPMVVIPHDKDQPMVASRLTELGAGYCLSKDSLTAAKLLFAVEVLEKEKYMEGIHKIDESFKASGGVPKAIKIVKNYLSSGFENEYETH